MTSPADADALFQENLPLVERIARSMMRNLPHNIDIQDLKQSGMMGLMDAAARFDVRQGVTFITFASLRIKGAIHDELRALDIAPRSVRKDLREAENAKVSLEQALGRTPRDSEIAIELGLELAEYQQLMADKQSAQITYLDDLENDDEGFIQEDAGIVNPPSDFVEFKASRDEMTLAIKTLSEREQTVLSYVIKDTPYKKICEEMGISKSRVSDLRLQALSKLQFKLLHSQPQES
jgi:RNA polymerase sigma factor for flagellar operon FliA